MPVEDIEEPAPAPPGRKRPKPGERRVQILQTLAADAEQPGAERITTAALAAKLDVSEARCTVTLRARRRCSKGSSSSSSRACSPSSNQITERETAGSGKRRRSFVTLLQFGEKNPGMTRVMSAMRSSSSTSG